MEKIVHGDHRIDIYRDGLNGPDGVYHDHIHATYNNAGQITTSGMADRSVERENLARGIGRTALGGF